MVNTKSFDCDNCPFTFCRKDGYNRMSKVNNHKPRLNKYFRDRKYKRKLEKLADIHGWLSGAAYIPNKTYEEWDWMQSDYDDWAKENKKYIKRYYRDNHVPGRNSFLKKISRRKVRRYKGDVSNGAGYKKIYDFWWELN